MQVVWKKISSPYGLVLLGGALFSLGLLTGYVIPYPSPISGEIHLGSSKKYSYINPLLSCGDISSVPEKKIKKIKSDLNTFIAKEKDKGNAQDVSVYFRDLNNGAWFAIDITQEFSPGSLLKVPLVVATYKRSETDPHFLSETVFFATSTMIRALSQEIPTGDSILPGKTYSIQELLKHMILDSDNNATNLIYSKLGLDTVNQTFLDLGIPEPSGNTDYNITVRDYSRFFRILYNATYLSPETSENTLHLLAETRFKAGLVAGVPPDIQVAHKFGEREVGMVSQLHDCGIIYAKKQPYVLCVMSRGNSLTNLSEAIAGISKIVYTSISTE